MISTNIDSNLRYDTLDKLLYRIPRVVVVNKFNEESALKFANDMQGARNAGMPVIPVIIDSYGGEVYSLLSMVDTIRSYAQDTPVATIVTGKAMSCGAILFTCGTEGYRYMGPNATLMIHDVASAGRGKVEEIKADAKETDRLQDHVYEMMAKNCGHEPKYFWKIVHEKGRADWYLDPKEARLHNIANHVRVPGMKLSVKCSLEFA
jgi:ATP-dependent Clp protease protease subunit